MGNRGAKCKIGEHSESRQRADDIHQYTAIQLELHSSCLFLHGNIRCANIWDRQQLNAVVVHQTSLGQTWMEVEHMDQSTPFLPRCHPSSGGDRMCDLETPSPKAHKAVRMALPWTV